MPRRCLAILVTLLLAGAAVSRDAAAADHLCRAGKPARAPRGTPPYPPFTPRLGVTVGDPLSHGGTPAERLLDLERPDALCVPVGEDSGTTSPLAGYAAEPTGPRPSRFRPRAHVVQTRFGLHHLQVTRAPERILFPAEWAGGTTIPPGHPGLASGERFACYRVTKRGASPRTLRVESSPPNATTPSPIDLLRPSRLCVPANVNGDDAGAVTRDRGMLCFTARVGRAWRTRNTVATRTVLDPALLQIGPAYELCVAAREPDATNPTPAATPPGGPTPLPTATGTGTGIPTPTTEATPNGVALVALKIEPQRAALKPGESLDARAIGTFSDGSTRDVTEEVEWTCSACVAPNTPGDRGRIVAGTYETPWGSVNASDEAAGQWAYIQLEVSQAPAPLLVYPYYNVIRQFDFDHLTALRLQDGGYWNVTQDVVWSSNKPNIAAATNPPTERSRIDGLSPGMAQIVATDPVTGHVSEPATFDVFGPLANLDVLMFGVGTSAGGATTLDVGAVGFPRAWGFFDYGFTFEQLRGGITFSSSAPDVVSVVTHDADFPRTTRSELRAARTGVAVISAYDPLTGLTSTDHGCDLRVTVRNPAVALRLQPAARQVGLDETIRLTALGVAADGTTRNLTQRATYTSSDPNVVLPIPDINFRDRSRLLAVGPGVATITAVVEQGGNGPTLTTTTATVTTITVRNERATRVVVEPPSRRTIVGTHNRFVARAFYPSGASNFVTDSVTWVSDKPAVADRSMYSPSRVQANARGTATITATLPSGVSSAATDDDATLVVDKPVAVRVVPAVTSIATGDTVTVSALAQLSNGDVLDLTDNELTPDPRWAPVYFRTSAPDVARSANTCRVRDYIYPTQPIIGVAPGTATIRAVSWATDPPLESSPADSATITVGP